jgi:hypothetical protein
MSFQGPGEVTASDPTNGGPDGNVSTNSEVVIKTLIQTGTELRRQ